MSSYLATRRPVLKQRIAVPGSAAVQYGGTVICDFATPRLDAKAGMKKVQEVAEQALKVLKVPTPSYANFATDLALIWY
eukprot:1464994-Rhodomonas_salina.3